MINWEKQLDKVHEFQRIIGYGIQSGISSDNFEKFSLRIRQELEKILPPELKYFFEKTNGVGFGGVLLYECNEGNRRTDLVENNLDWYTNDELRKYLILGDGNISWYVYLPDEKKYQILDKPSGELMEEFEDVNDFLEGVFNEMSLED
ncbi:SMI1/KNR4 family protein [Lactococcus hodotermopsidis]|uniref:SMI1/KNR4 family protein n=1 Tax=Pseudolactococcus hodotermopsidis TaxID=2709157 RepID=A0A6A0BGE8_9LACT|nr:YrhA family protein [Lactococcus hodotermopsidis]GFH43438.1 SMI1/KNR4 family protein [Lactococcus hodotermopsidis]